MDVALTYTITGGGNDSVPLHFVEGELEQPVTLPNGDARRPGRAHVTAGGESATVQLERLRATAPRPPSRRPTRAAAADGRPAATMIGCAFQ